MSEHWRDYVSKKEKSHMLKHTANHHHNQPPPEYILTVVKYCRTALQRQIFEAVRIGVRARSGCEVMNSKAEWNGSRLPRIIIEQGEDLTEDIEVGLNRGLWQGRKSLQ